MFFGYTSEFQELCKQIPEKAKTVVLRLSRMQYMDQTGLYVMEDALKDLNQKSVNIVFVGLLDQPKNMMERVEIIPNIVKEENIYTSFKEYLKVISA